MVTVTHARGYCTHLWMLIVVCLKGSKKLILVREYSPCSCSLLISRRLGFCMVSSNQDTSKSYKVMMDGNQENMSPLEETWRVLLALIFTLKEQNIWQLKHSQELLVLRISKLWLTFNNYCNIPLPNAWKIILNIYNIILSTSLENTQPIDQFLSLSCHDLEVLSCRTRRRCTAWRRDVVVFAVRSCTFSFTGVPAYRNVSIYNFNIFW